MDRWQNYRKAYSWQPKITIPHTPEKIRNVWFYNGERDFYDYPIKSDTTAQLRVIPRYLDFVWRPPGRDAQSFKFTFNEQEIFTAFASLSELPNINAKPLVLHFAVNPTVSGYDTRVTLEHPEKTIELSKTQVEVSFSL